jgi:hypothetical protein
MWVSLKWSYLTIHLNKNLIDLKIKNQLESKLIIEVDVLFFLARYRKRNLNLTLIVNEICSHYEN